ncbi:hypothetical protein EmuJ_000224200 [Echinococcus multilocularis]|uniref:Uncharacterized protein n=1 Tax=Echinococcus multilocularis TaxID=6211 RepID=A0A087W1H0_ECHMU|nr:hypothetical protein EmuJ_000224200 [Echinococcus multilocularis]
MFIASCVPTADSTPPSVHSKGQRFQVVIRFTITCQRSMNTEGRGIFKHDVIGDATIMEPTRSFSRTGRSSSISDYADNESKIIEQTFLCPLDNSNLSQMVHCIEIPKIRPRKCLSPDSNQSGNAVSLVLPCIPEPQKPSRRTHFLSPTLLENTNDNQKVYYPHARADSTLESPVGGNNMTVHKTSLSKRRPLYLPLPRRTSCRYPGDSNQLNRRGKPMWNMSSRVNSRPRSVSSVSPSPVRSVRSTSIPTKLIPFEHSKPKLTPIKRTSVFDRLYRESSRQKYLMRIEALENPIKNHWEHRLLSPPQSFLRTSRSNLTYSQPKKRPLDAHSIMVSPVHPPHPVGIPPPSLSKSHIEWRSDSLQPQPRTESAASASAFFTLMIRKSREESEKVPITVNKIQQPPTCIENAKEWDNISAKPCQLDDKDAINESLNELILQLIEEQPSAPINAFVSENVVSWKSLTALFAEETHASANIIQVQGLSDKLLPDYTSKWKEHSGPHAKSTEVYRLMKAAHQKLPYKEFESVVIFDPACANAILREHDTDYSSSPNLTTVADKVIGSACQEVSSPSDLQLTSFPSPHKINTSSINRPVKGDHDDKEAHASTPPPKQEEGGGGLKQGQDGGLKSNRLDCIENKIIVANSTLMRSCIEVIEPYGESSPLMDSTDLLAIPPLSNNSSTERRSKSGEQDSFIDESLVSLNSASEYFFQEYVELLKPNKPQTNEPADREEDGKTQRRLIENHAPDTEFLDQLSVHQLLHQREVENSEFSMSKVEVSQDRCFEQATLNKSNFAYLSTDLESYETEKVCKGKGSPKLSGSTFASKVINEKRQWLKAASSSSSFLAANVKLIVAPKDKKTEFSQSSLRPLSFGTNLSAQQGSYKIFQVSSLTGSESSKQELLVLPDYGPCKHQISETRRL